MPGIDDVDRQFGRMTGDRRDMTETPGVIGADGKWRALTSDGEPPAIICEHPGGCGQESRCAAFGSCEVAAITSQGRLMIADAAPRRNRPASSVSGLSAADRREVRRQALELAVAAFAVSPHSMQVEEMPALAAIYERYLLGDDADPPKPAGMTWEHFDRLVAEANDPPKPPAKME